MNEITMNEITGLNLKIDIRIISPEIHKKTIKRSIPDSVLKN
ncbi:MAG: hypothetical protein NVSMB45_17320 [Ginsengibacter sp.]